MFCLFGFIIVICWLLLCCFVGLFVFALFCNSVVDCIVTILCVWLISVCLLLLWLVMFVVLLVLWFFVLVFWLCCCCPFMVDCVVVLVCLVWVLLDLLVFLLCGLLNMLLFDCYFGLDDGYLMLLAVCLCLLCFAVGCSLFGYLVGLRFGLFLWCFFWDVGCLIVFVLLLWFVVRLCVWLVVVILFTCGI